MRSNRKKTNMVAALFLLVLSAMQAAGHENANACATQHFGAEANRDKTGTEAATKNDAGWQVLGNSALADRTNFKAEGKGFEPSTSFPAPDSRKRRFYAVDN